MLEIAFVLILLNTPEGVLGLNPAHVVSLRNIPPQKKQLLHGQIQCVIRTVDGKFITVIESCAEVSRLIAEALK